MKDSLNPTAQLLMEIAETHKITKRGIDHMIEAFDNLLERLKDKPFGQREIKIRQKLGEISKMLWVETGKGSDITIKDLNDLCVWAEKIEPYKVDWAVGNWDLVEEKEKLASSSPDKASEITKKLEEHGKILEALKKKFDITV